MRWQHFPLAAILLISLVMHVAAAAATPDLVFDENYYVTEARGILAGWGPLYLEHPPLAKLFLVTSIRFFGDDPLGWRFFPILCGTCSIVFVYLICRELTLPRRAVIIATFLFAFENLAFLQSGIAMLDVFSVTLMLGAFYLYLRSRYIAGGLALALSSLAKLAGVLGGLAVFLDWLVSNRKRPLTVLLLASSAAIFFVALFPLLDYALSHRIGNPIGLLQTALVRTASLTFDTGFSPAASPPASWILDYHPFFLVPLPQYLAAVSPTVWLMIVPVMIYMVSKTFKGSRAAAFSLAWFAGTYLIWIPVEAVTGRMTYLYYFYPTVGAVCIGLALALHDLLEARRAKAVKYKRLLISAAAYGYLAAHFAFWIVLSPVFPSLALWLPIR